MTLLHRIETNGNHCRLEMLYISIERKRLDF